MSRSRLSPPLERCSWPVRAYRLGEEPSDNLSANTTAEERLAMMWPLAIEAWELSGRTLPEYPRSEIPVRLRPWPPPPDSSS